MKSIGASIAEHLRKRKASGNPLHSSVLQVAGFGLISAAFGMWLLPVGIGVAGVSLLVLEWLSRP